MINSREKIVRERKKLSANEARAFIAIEYFVSLQKTKNISPLTGGCSEGLDAFRFSFKLGRSVLNVCVQVNKENSDRI